MSLSETMTALMDKARKLTGLTEKISIVQLTSLMDHFNLHVNDNLLGDSGTTLAGSNVILSNPKNIIEDGNDKIYMTTLHWDQVAFLVTLDPGTYTYSADLMNPLDSSGALFFLQDPSGRSIFSNFPPIPFAKDNAWHRCKQTFSVKETNSYRVFFTNVNKQKNAKLELGDLATPLTKVGG